MLYEPTVYKIKKSGLTFSIAIETENLGMAGIEDLEKTIASLETQSYPVHEVKEIFIIIGSRISNDTLSFFRTKYPWLTIQVEDKDLSYVEAKMRGAEIATGDIVVFADSDVVYDDTWLLNMLYVFIYSPGTAVATGETRIGISSIYKLAIQFTWMMDLFFKQKYPRPVKDFHLNSLAIKRDVMLSVPFLNGFPVYRANIVEWKKQLMFRGYSIMRVPFSEGRHAPPGNFIDWWYRMLISGADAIVKADLYFYPDGSVVEKFSPFRRLVRVPLLLLHRILKMIAQAVIIFIEYPSKFIKILLAIPVALVFILVQTFGAIIALFNKEFLFNKITSREHKQVV